MTTVHLLLCRFSTPKANPGASLKPFGGAVTSPEGYLLALWVHECRRVFADKLVTYDDKGWVDKAITDLCRQEFPPELCKQVRAGCLGDHSKATGCFLIITHVTTSQLKVAGKIRRT